MDTYACADHDDRRDKHFDLSSTRVGACRTFFSESKEKLNKTKKVNTDGTEKYTFTKVLCPETIISHLTIYTSLRELTNYSS